MASPPGPNISAPTTRGEEGAFLTFLPNRRSEGPHPGKKPISSSPSRSISPEEQAPHPMSNDANPRTFLLTVATLFLCLPLNSHVPHDIIYSLAVSPDYADDCTFHQRATPNLKKLELSSEGAPFSPPLTGQLVSWLGWRSVVAVIMLSHHIHGDLLQ
ncbi:MAG: hypothetical protein AAF191_17450 [Verrucomicrobiota bacterium]